jgi:hypothetical protein
MVVGGSSSWYVFFQSTTTASADSSVFATHHYVDSVGGSVQNVGNKDTLLTNLGSGNMGVKSIGGNVGISTATTDTTVVFSIKGWDDWDKVTLQTTNNTITTIKSITCPNDATGTLVVEMIATKDDNSKSLSGRKTVHWHSTAGAVTVDEIIDDNADYLRGLSTAIWTVDASGATLRIRGTGESATNIDWTPTYKLKYNSYAL